MGQLPAMTITLLQLTRVELESLAASQVPESLASRTEPGSLPPSFVATRALLLAAQGQPEPWSWCIGSNATRTDASPQSNP